MIKKLDIYNDWLIELMYRPDYTPGEQWLGLAYERSPRRLYLGLGHYPTEEIARLTMRARADCMEDAARTAGAEVDRYVGDVSINEEWSEQASAGHEDNDSSVLKFGLEETTFIDSYQVYQGGRVVERGRMVLENGVRVKRPDIRRVNYKTGPSRYTASRSKRTFTCFSTDDTGAHRVRRGPRFSSLAAYNMGPNGLYQPCSWQMSKADYRTTVELHRNGEQPDWAPEQAAQMPKHIKEMYSSIKQEQEARAVAAGREWVRLVIQAYSAGEFTLDDPRLNDDAWLAIQVALECKKKGAVKYWWKKAWAWNVFKPGELVKGERVFHRDRERYITITRARKKTADGKDGRGISYQQIPVEALFRLSPMDLQTQFLDEFGMTQERLLWAYRKRRPRLRWQRTRLHRRGGRRWES